MQALLDQYGPWLGLLGLAAALALAVVVVLQTLRLRALTRKWSGLMDGATSGNLESLLKDHLHRSVSVEDRLSTSESRLKSLETKMEASKRYVGLVRYDAFDDVGGSQSFALAIYDERGDGAVVTSMVGRTDCRVYAKEIKGGKATRDLSAEEQRAIESAVLQREPATAAKGGK